MTKVYITRHGQTKWNVEGRMQGQKDSRLTTLGQNQAKWLGDSLKDIPIDIIISSSSGRTISTAELIRGDRNIEIIPNDNLREMYIGEWEGMLHTEVEELYPEQRFNFWHNPHLYEPMSGESFADVLVRASNEIEDIITTYKNKNILIVTHAITLKSLIAYFEKKEIKDLWTGAFMKSTCLNILEIDGDNRNFILQGDTSHYPTDDAI
ncbi:histidine phosphatase family protein [Vallitalea okinawensis]|uniref:histidine phosphatase family protein n=1 Tax=Vallitalea okinawensis TaxID=2078660 RepID=UPI000CFB8730|nr:histidine phosphatase family protein [Vallitalea okinawensis]